MNPNEPTLLTHLNEARTGFFAEGGLSNVIFCGKFKQEVDLSLVLQTHRKVVEDEVNNESTNVTGILIVQVRLCTLHTGDQQVVKLSSFTIRNL